MEFLGCLPGTPAKWVIILKQWLTNDKKLEDWETEI